MSEQPQSTNTWNNCIESFAAPIKEYVKAYTQVAICNASKSQGSTTMTEAQVVPCCFHEYNKLEFLHYNAILKNPIDKNYKSGLWRLCSGLICLWAGICFHYLSWEITVSNILSIPLLIVGGSVAIIAFFVLYNSKIQKQKNDDFFERQGFILSVLLAYQVASTDKAKEMIVQSILEYDADVIEHFSDHDTRHA